MEQKKRGLLQEILNADKNREVLFSATLEVSNSALSSCIIERVPVTKIPTSGAVKSYILKSSLRTIMSVGGQLPPILISIS